MWASASLDRSGFEARAPANGRRLGAATGVTDRSGLLVPFALESSLDVSQLAVLQVWQNRSGHASGSRTGARPRRFGAASRVEDRRPLTGSAGASRGGGEGDTDLEPAGEAGGVLPPSSCYPSKLAMLCVVVPVVCVFPTEAFFSTDA